MDRTEYYLALMRGPRNRSNVEMADMLISKVAYGSYGPTYYGLAPQGSATSAAKWRIEELSYDVNGNYTGSKYSLPDQIWDDRAGLTYT